MKESQHPRTNRRSKVLDELKRHTLQNIEAGKNAGVQANTIAEELFLDRSNVSKELNFLYRSGQVIKQQGKPTLYLHKDALYQRYPGCFIPATISRGHSIDEYISSEHSPSSIIVKTSNELENMIGANGSLKYAIQQAKAAVTYPPHGLHTIVAGNVGVGKTNFAKAMYLYGISNGKIQTNADFITFNCQDYASSPQLLISQLFGYAKGAVSGSERGRKGLVEAASGGILYLNGVDKLPPKAQDMLITLIEKNTFSRLGDASVERQADTMIIAATTESLDFSTVSKLVRKIPICISLPDIDNRGAEEILEYIFLFFNKEADTINVPIKVHKDILASLVAVKHIGNIGELKSSVKNIIAHAYLEFSTSCSHSQVMDVTYRHLPKNISGALLTQNARIPDIVELFSRVNQEYVLFTPGAATPFPALFESEQKPPMEPLTDKSIRLDIPFDTDDVGSYISHCVSRLQSNSSAQFNTLREMVQGNLYDTLFETLSAYPEYSSIIQNTSLFYGLLLHVSNVIKRLENSFEVRYHTSDDISINNPKEYAAAKRVVQSIYSRMNILLPEPETGFIAMYLYLAAKWTDSSTVALIAVFHGSNIAESMAKYVNSVCGCNLISWINFQPQMSYEELMESVVQRAREVNQGSGVLLLTDMEPLTSLHTHITHCTGIKAETLSGVSLPVMLTIANRSLKAGYTIRALLSEALNISEIGTVEQSPMESVGTSFIHRIVNEILSESLTFLNPTKAAYTLLSALDLILSALQLDYSDEIGIKFIFHCSNMVERIIRGDPYKFAGLKQFINNNSWIMALLEKNMSGTSEVFGITIPSSELAYVAEIFLPYLKPQDA